MIYVPTTHELRRMERKELDRLAVRLFSVYIRSRDADHRGFVKCYTCDKVDHWDHMHCGHFVKRGNMCTRFMEANNNPQCPRCNVELYGNIEVYAERLDKEHGEGMADYLAYFGRQTCKWARSDYYELIQIMEKKLYGKEE